MTARDDWPHVPSNVQSMSFVLKTSDEVGARLGRGEKGGHIRDPSPVGLVRCLPWRIADLVYGLY